jgi:pilus assembly protein CpaF
LNIVISGPTGSGNTTLLNALGNETDCRGRMLVVEETRELKLPDLVPLCVSMEAQDKSAEGTGEIPQRELVRNALRMRPAPHYRRRNEGTGDVGPVAGQTPHATGS